MSTVCVYNVKQDQASMFLQLHFPSAAQDLVMQREHDLSLKHGVTHVGLELATLERTKNSANPPRPGDLPSSWRPFLDPFLGGSACGGDCVHHQNRLALHGSTSTGEQHLSREPVQFEVAS